MCIGALRVELFVSDSNSLKAKRIVLKSLKDRIRHNFNVSVAEVNEHDKWQKAILGVAAVGVDKAYVNGLLDKCMDFIRQNHRIHIVDFTMEIL